MNRTRAMAWISAALLVASPLLAFPLSAAERERASATEGGGAVTVFMARWREPGAIALTPLPLASLSPAPSPWRDARRYDDVAADNSATLLQGAVPREFGVRVRLSETDTAFVKILSFRGSPRAKSLRTVPYLPETMLERPAAKAFAAGVKLRF